MNTATIIIAIITFIILLLSVSGIFTLLNNLISIYRLKIDSEVNTNIRASGLLYKDTMDLIDSIIDRYITEDAITNPYPEYISEKQIINRISEITANILEELSDDIFIMISPYIKPQKIKEVINRRVAISIINIAKNNNTNINPIPKKNNNINIYEQIT